MFRNGSAFMLNRKRTRTSISSNTAAAAAAAAAAAEEKPMWSGPTQKLSTEAHCRMYVKNSQMRAGYVNRLHSIFLVML